MADDNNSRYRPNEPSRRGPAQAEPASDPLVELARLIGRSDPFAELARESRGREPEAGYRGDEAPSRYDGDAAGRADGDLEPRYGGEPPRFSAEPPSRYSPEPPPLRYGTDRAPRYREEPPARDEWPAPPPAHAEVDPFAVHSPPHLPLAHAPAEQHYAPPHFLSPQVRPEADGQQPDQRGFGAAAYPSELGPAPFQPAPALYPEEPEGGQMPPPHDDEFYDDAPRGGRRKQMMMVAAVLGLAVIGTAGAFGYRSLFGGVHVSAPPVIRASGEPSKVAPPPAAADQSPSKINYDRFGDRGKDEQVVVREERPVDSKDLARSSVPRSMFPFPAAPVTGLPQPPGGGANAAVNTAPSALGEPRRVRTVPIRPDQPEMASVPPVGLPPLAASRQANASSAPREEPPPVAARAASPPPAASSRSSPRVAARAALPPEPAANAPLSLSPSGANANAPSPPAAVRESPRAAARVASAPVANGGGGGYLVQVSSQRSQADAETSFRNIQAKYSSLLGSQRHLVRRADLGSRGIYYRAMVGPFGTRDQAIQLCTNLKAAGGACVVQSN